MAAYKFCKSKIHFSVNRDDIQSSNCKVFVIGTFNGWQLSDKWEMKTCDNGFCLERNIKDISAPGNSGYPECKFYIKQFDEYADIILNEDRNEVKDIFKTDNFILCEKIIKKSYHSGKALDYLNFRKLPGKFKKNRLFRSPHPCIKAKNYQGDISNYKELIKTNKIEAVINLVDKQNDHFPEFYSNMIKQGRVLFLPMSYSEVYWNSNTKAFSNKIQIIENFLKLTGKSTLIHCSLGVDRTGVISAILSMLRGSGINEIFDDYERSNQFLQDEYRDRHLLKYSLDNFSRKKSLDYLV